MSADLVKRLRAADRGYPTMLSTAADRIEQLERDLAKSYAAQVNLRGQIEDMSGQLATEKALAEDIFEAWRLGVEFNPSLTLAAYRKARGL